MSIRNYYLGCPGWGMKTWVGRMFPAGTKNTDFLARYAEVFNTVEGNTTFYALPTPDIVTRWRESVSDSFRFCFKFPRPITHDKMLVGAEAEVTEFFDRIDPLADVLGTLMIQLPPRFAPKDLDRLGAFIDGLPKAFHYAVEARHEQFFTGGADEDAIVAMLRERSVDWVIMDTRGIHASHSLQFADIRARKPNYPVVMRATANAPIVRCVPHDDFTQQAPFLAQWPAQIARWIADGKKPYFFMHAPDDTFAPENAYALHALLQPLADVGELPKWPQAPTQLGLF